MDSNKWLKEFLEQWISFSEGKNCSFDPKVGLCSNLEFWLEGEDLSWEQARPVIILLKDLLHKYDPLSEVYPFGGERVYVTEMKAGTMHLNEERVAWAKRTVSSL